MAKRKIPFLNDAGQLVKICTRCEQIFPATSEYFYVFRVNKLRPICKTCSSKWGGELQKQSAERVRKGISPVGDPTKTRKCGMCKRTLPATVEYFFTHPGSKFNLAARCKTCHIEYGLKKSRTEKYKARAKKHYNETRSSQNKRSREYYKVNRERILRNDKEYKKRNPDVARRAYRKMFLNPEFRISKNVSSGIRDSLFRRKGKDGYHWEELVDFTRKDLVKHLEKQFQPGMTWDNYGLHGWHIDHIIPVTAFNFKSYNDIDFKKCWALKNLQPMWAKENISKGNKLEKPFQPSLAFG
jgi:hypothetical protein